ncbi:MAG TPA: Ku protein [Gemmatimonadaceae bacterium]|jgi:DNA end-binding protein Ku|nr:Ku protein [Gemmatimonadaceae bacterium]
MATIWKGAITFGLVNIPVELRPAVRAGGDTVSFRQLHKEDNSPIHLDRVCDADGTVVPWGDIVKGYEYAKGKFVVITDEEIKAATVATAKTLEILDFVKTDEIDPRFFDTPYFIVPQKGAERAYALLREAIRKSGMVGVGKFALRQKEQLASIKAVGDALVLEVMRFAAELVPPTELTFPAADGVKPAELKMAEALIESLTTPFEPTKYHDQYHENIMAIIKAKLKGEAIDTEEPAEPQGTDVLDLMAKLQESLKAGGKKKARAGATAETGEAGAESDTAATTGGPPPRAKRAARPRKTA